MSLNVFVQGVRVATLDSPDGFGHVMSYLPGVAPEHFVSLTMPVEGQTYRWPTLHPFFQVSLPEGFLLAVLKEQLGPHLGARPLDLLSVVGHDLIGRVQVSAGERPQADLAVTTERHIVKARSEHQPFIALNEHLCMQVAQRTGVPTAATVVSDDGQVLVVERFDIDAATGQRKGFEDFCSLLGLSPDQKYESTWERVARLVRDYVPAQRQRQSNERLAVTLLLTHALGNADCHTKNLGFLYTDLQDVEVAPVYDMLSILAYDRCADNPPGMYLDGRKSWDASKALWRYLQQQLGFEPAAQRELVDRVCSAVDAVVPELLQRIRHTPGFQPVGLRMLWEWNEGMKRLRERRSFVVPDWVETAAAQGLPTPAAAEKFAAARLGESPLMAPRPKKRRTRPAS